MSLQCDVHLLTAREDLQVRDTDFSCFKYHDKAVLKSQAERPYAIDKTSFAVGRGQKWYLENKRPERLRTNLKELEELLSEQGVIPECAGNMLLDSSVSFLLPVELL